MSCLITLSEKKKKRTALLPSRGIKLKITLILVDSTSTDLVILFSFLFFLFDTSRLGYTLKDKKNDKIFKVYV